MSSISMCRVCLVGNTTLHSLENNLLRDVFEKLSNTKFFSEDSRPRAVCCYCYQKLLRCHTFSQMVIRSEDIFSQFYDQGFEATHEYISEINTGMKQQYSVATMQFITIDCKYDNSSKGGSQVSVKHEPPSVYIQEEVTTEQDKLVEAQSAPENCTRSLITFEEDNSDQGVEPITTVEIKEEVTTEQDKLVQDESFTEICTRSQLIFEEESNNLEIDVEQLPSTIQLEQTKRDTEIKEISKMSLMMPFACNVCGKQFNQKSNLTCHMRIHTGEKPFACNVCDKQFTQKSTLVNHMKTHTGEKPFACHSCGKLFVRKSNFVDHMRIHTGEKPFSCNVCDKQFIHKSSLVSHIKNHTGRNKFSCDVCGKQFNKKFSLTCHMRIHTGEKPFACNVCDKQFNQKSSLVGHMKTHTGEKPFACNLCGEQFVRKSNFVDHMRIHTGEQPFTNTNTNHLFAGSGLQDGMLILICPTMSYQLSSFGV